MTTSAVISLVRLATGSFWCGCSCQITRPVAASTTSAAPACTASCLGTAAVANRAGSGATPFGGVGVDGDGTATAGSRRPTCRSAATPARPGSHRPPARWRRPTSRPAAARRSAATAWAGDGRAPASTAGREVRGMRKRGIAGMTANPLRQLPSVDALLRSRWPHAGRSARACGRGGRSAPGPGRGPGWPGTPTPAEALLARAGELLEHTPSLRGALNATGVDRADEPRPRTD